MEIKVRRIDVRNLVGALAKMSEVKLPVRVDYFRARNLKLLQSSHDAGWEAQQTKLKEYYVACDELRKKFKDTKEDSKTFKDELDAVNTKFQADIKEVEAFLEEETTVPVHTITLETLGDLVLPQGVMDLVQLLIVEETTK